MIRRFISGIHWADARIIIRCARLMHGRTVPILLAFYVLTVLTALTDGAGMVLLINLMTGSINDASADLVTKGAVWFLRRSGRAADPLTVLLLIVAIFAVRSVLVFTSQAMEVSLNAWIRRQIQEHGFAAVLRGDWEVLRDMRVGQRLGAITEESVIVAKYLMSILRMIMAVVTGLILMGLAALVSAQLTAIMLFTGIPAVIVLQLLFSRVSRLSRVQVAERQGFAADVTERFSGLFHIKVEGDSARHIHDGLRHQPAYTSLDVRIGVWQSAITAFNVVLPALVLLEFAAWFALRGESLATSMNLLASVGIVGARAAAQFNNAEGAFGNLSRLSGSLVPVAALFGVTPEPLRENISERVVAVQLRNVRYRYPAGGGVDGVTLDARLGQPLLLRGPSGSGKTTIANLLAGVYRPQEGSVVYLAASGRQYSALTHRPKIGYVAQDIHLFHGSVRENLGGVADPDDWIWTCLARAGAAHVVRELGGLDGQIAEAGRSLSGGERRRMGIARVLVGRPELLILDEVTAGLDDVNRAGIAQTMASLAQELVVVAVSHDPLELPGAEEWILDGGARQLPIAAAAQAPTRGR